MSLVRPKNEGDNWVRLAVIMMLVFTAILVFMAVIPSWFIYFADGDLKWKTATFLDTSGGHLAIQVKSQQTRDVIVLIYYGIALTGFGLAIKRYNKRHTKVLPPGEEKREATGGYK